MYVGVETSFIDHQSANMIGILCLYIQEHQLQLKAMYITYQKVVCIMQIKNSKWGT